MKKIMLDVKPFQETLHAGMCGPASLKIVLDYYGLVKSEQELAGLTGTTIGLGTDDKGIARVVESLGFKVVIKNESDFSNIEKWLTKGVPVIVDWFTRGREDYPPREMADGHYSVVAGLDDDFIYLQDPETGGLREIARDDFMKVWFDFSGEYIKADELIVRQLIAIYK
ncbi:MAG: C39 family peptidase [Candidatus Berkelbacteria bacterium]|nr:C39 family peptidase [Candidatus Berkelbacteria bacterium]